MFSPTYLILNTLGFAAQSMPMNQWMNETVILIALLLTTIELVLISLIMLPTMWFISWRRRGTKLRTIENKKYVPVQINHYPNAEQRSALMFGPDSESEIARLIDSVDLDKFEEELMAV